MDDLSAFQASVAAVIGEDRKAVAAAAKTEALRQVLAERQRQDAKSGQQDLDPITYLAVLTEEVGKLSQAALHTRFGGPAAAGLLTQAVHTAAVSLAIVECLLRGVWQWPVPIVIRPSLAEQDNDAASEALS